MADLDGCCCEVTPTFCAMLGRDLKALVGHRIQHFIVTHRGPVLDELIDELLAGVRKRAGVEVSILRGDGSIGWMLLSVALVLDAERRPDYLFLQLQDISGWDAADPAPARMRRQLPRFHDGAVGVVAAALAARDPYIAEHHRRVGELVRGITTELATDPDLAEGIHLAATVHDLGKIVVPDEVLSKPGSLTPAEYALVKAHPAAGNHLLASVELPWPVARMVREHHERLDGSGYPAGLVGADIHFGSRVLAVADVVEAMCADRPHRRAPGLAAALARVSAGRGSEFDPDVVDACLRCVERWGGMLIAA